MGKLSKFLRNCARCVVLFIICCGTSGAFAAGYTCPTYKKYTSCSSGYYLNGTAAGNSCASCPSGCTCAGGTAAPVCGVTCAAGTYWNGSSCATCNAGYACPGFTNISNPANGYGANSCDGANQYQNETGKTTCKTVSTGYYRVDRTAQAQCTGNTYCSGGVKFACPDTTEYTKIDFPASYYSPTISSFGLISGNGRTDISQCRALTWYTNSRGRFYENTSYNSETNKYDIVRDWGYSDVNPGYYLTSKAGCGAYAYYTEVKDCPEGAYYCPGKGATICNGSNQATVHTTNFGLETCPNGYNANTATKKTEISQCQISCSAGSYLASAGATQCADVGAGYWSEQSKTGYGNLGVRNACPAGLTTYGRGAGADEAADCGHIFYVGANKRLFLRSAKKTTPSLNVKIGNQIFYGNMRTKSFAKGNMLHVMMNGTNYSVYDDIDAATE